MMRRPLSFLALLPSVVALLLVSVPAIAATLNNSEHEARIDEMLRGMTLEQKIAQMIQPEIRYITPEDVRRYGFGSILNGGGSFPQGNKHASLADWRALADAYYHASLDSSLGSAGIPIIWGTDAVHGHGNVLGATVFPHNIGLGATRNPQLLEKIAVATAQEVRASGLDWIFAPTVAVALDARWGRTYESYSTDPALVARYAGPVVRGLQSRQTIATAKHFIGDGGTLRGIDQGDTVLDLDELLALHGTGYLAAIDAGVLSVMASFNSWNGRKVHGHPELLTTLLKEKWGFAGIVVSDWNGIGQVQYCGNADCAQAINAGIDVVMVPEDWRELFDTMLRQVREGEIAQSRIDDAVRRILRVKLHIGVFDGLSPSERADALGARTVGDQAHREIAAQAVRESLVLLKNNGRVLPLRPGQRVLVTGSGAASVGHQAGGWTLTWQGTGNVADDFPGASTVLDGIRHHAAQPELVQYSAQGSYDARPDVAVVVFGEDPYAEGVGDVRNLNHSARYPRDLALMRSLRADGVPVVAVYLTGRPAWVNPELNASDAFVVAWLPGSEGAAVADVLYAHPGGAHDFRGRLPMPWPAADLNNVDPLLPVANHLFPEGYGLRLVDAAPALARLDEESLAAEELAEILIFSRRTQPPWQMMLADSTGARRRVDGPQVRSSDGSITVWARDHRVQEDVRVLQWSRVSPGAEPGRVFWRHGSGHATDIVARLGDTARLVLRLKLTNRPSGRVELRVECDSECAGAVDVAPTLRNAKVDQWYDLTLPIACFVEAGALLNKVSAPLVMSSDGEFELTLADLRYTAVAAPPEGEAVSNCASTLNAVTGF